VFDGRADLFSFSTQYKGSSERKKCFNNEILKKYKGNGIITDS
jgi:hypothetical protein